MKITNILSLGISALLLFSCTTEKLSQEFVEILDASLGSKSRLSLSEDGKPAWESGDKLSLFVDGTENECWLLSGGAGQSKASFSHFSKTSRSDVNEVRALYPYDVNYSPDAELINVSMPVQVPLMAAISNNLTGVNFKYLTAMVRLDLVRSAKVSNFIVTAYGDETPGGTFAVDFGGSLPCLKQVSSSAELVLPGGESSMFLLNIPPMNYKSGFQIKVNYASGDSQIIRHSLAEDFQAGEILDIKQMTNASNLVLSLDFRSSNPFKETMPSTKGTGDPADTLSEGRVDKTYTLVQDGVDYKFKVHSGYFIYKEPDSRAGQLEYGHAWTTNPYLTPTVKNFTIGRAKSYLKLPAVPGKTLYALEYLAGNATTSVCLSLDAEGTKVCCPHPDSVQAGDIVKLFVAYSQSFENTEYYLFISGGNFLMPWCKVYYQ